MQYVCKKLIKNSQPFGKQFQKTVGGIFLLTLYVLKFYIEGTHHVISRMLNDD